MTTKERKMKNRFHEFFEEGDGRLSSIRLFSAFALLNAMFISWFGLYFNIPAQEIIMQEMPWLIAAFVPKAIQRFAEAKEFYATIPKGNKDESK